MRVVGSLLKPGGDTNMGGEGRGRGYMICKYGIKLINHYIRHPNLVLKRGKNLLKLGDIR